MHVLALDLGTSSARARLLDAAGRFVEGAEARRRYRDDGGTFGAEELVADARAVLAEARSQAPAPEAAVGVSCFWHSLVALDEHERPLTPVLGWNDVRSAEQARRLRERLDPVAVHVRTGCALHPSYWPAKLAWLRETEPETWARARRFVPFPDLLLLREAGELRTSLSQASATGLWTDDGWDAELLDELGLRPEQLPEVCDDPAAGWFPALGDGACSNLGTGCTTRERGAVMIGTSAALRVMHGDRSARPRPGLFRYRLDADRVVEGGSLSDGGNLYAWLERTLRLPDDARLAERAPAGHGLTFLPLLGGERSPGWTIGSRGAVAGLSFATTPEDLLQAALEGVALRFAEIADRLPELQEVVATGGALAQNDDWAQILADVLGLPVRRGVREGSARGAGVYALERLGAAAGVAPVGDAFEPRLDRAEAYRWARERQRDLYRGVT
ncbi:MAG TPA: gluconokinase [Gaiellaceae bacterium]|nr:gluconokinase [Gaiellaceae bacterium]